MKKNIGFSDKTVRMLIAAVLLGVFIADLLSGVWAAVALIVAGLMIVTSLVNFCPLYHLLGISTFRRKKMS
ncbi:YgaP family membrane protein [Larkinella sp. VNQ87]|uniref:YgaP family membrane protein n=1 Tax=Larkinella sp. VNQ87 TaxID=3400921 RepID=UPI003BFBA909